MWTATKGTASGSPCCGDPKYGDFVKLLDVAPGNDDQWAELNHARAVYLGQPIYIAFRYEGDFATEWYVDDINVTSPLVALNDGPTVLGSHTHLTAVIGSGAMSR